ncbi:MAG: NAD(P)-binding protein, partial [Actinomycetota bacterium]
MTDPAAVAVLTALARGALGAGYRPEVPAEMFRTLSQVPSETDRRRLLAALRALSTKPGALLLTGAPVPVSWLSPAAAEALLQRWKASRLKFRRDLAGTALALATSALYGHPGAEWERIGYPGPLGPPPDEPKRLTPLEVTNDEVLRCDVVIVGSGAGGACVAALLARSGLDVVVLERGGYRSESDFTHLESDSMRDMYLYGGVLAIEGEVTVGTLVAFNAYVLLLQTPFRTLGFFLMLGQRARASAGRIYELLDEPVTIADRPGAVDLVEPRGEVRFRDVSFAYPHPDRTGRRPIVLAGFDLAVAPGEAVAVVGATGSGKSTVTRLL